ncbi:UNVERIFIED_CONTAM: hypothetical protein PYX00_005049 [Menopon gallinae]|uniref:Acyl-coenzyme A oxidase n=1 Tax=Menopon gallinae TaxID=328185 RepID=A0AAW2HPW9_9NEOP
MEGSTASDILEAENTKTKLSIADELIEDMPSGALDEYRKRARFNWKVLRITLEGIENLKMKTMVWKTLESDTEFQHISSTPSCDEQQRIASRQLKRLHALKYKFLSNEILIGSYRRKTRYLMTLNEALAMVNRNLSIKFALGVSLFGNALPSLGTKRHLKYCDAAWRGELLSCFAITEIAHGSNTKNLRTTATYDSEKEEFVINTPDFQAAKCWVGNLGKTATFAIVFAQLKTMDGDNHGLHAFIVPIRDPNTMLPYPGITVGDMGEKIGLNGIDNGFIMFDQYRIAKENLLNKTGDVNENGVYETCFTNPQQILGAALENLSAGRLAITQECTNSLCCAITIAVRYAAVRRQFGPENKKEMPILEYPLHQWRLFPYLAASCVFKIFIADFTEQYLETVEKSYSSTVTLTDLTAGVAEIHAIISSCKPLVSWICRDAIQECREACGGFGYLKSSNLGELRNENDPSVTYEGDNNVLIQQTSNWLLRQWNNKDEIATSSPLGSIKFLEQYNVISGCKFIGSKVEDVTDFNFIKTAFRWLLCWLMKETEREMSLLQSNGADRFTARTLCQVYKARTLSLVFAEHNAISYTCRRLTSHKLQADIKAVLEKLVLTYGLWCIDRHLSYFYQGGFAEGPRIASLVRKGLTSLCRELVPDAVSIVDAVSPPDFVLKSVIGRADGNVYQHLEASLMKHAGGRPTWWREMVHSVTSKL